MAKAKDISIYWDGTEDKGGGSHIAELGISMQAIGVGGCGGNVLRYLLDQGRWHDRIKVAAANTDMQALTDFQPESRIQLGKEHAGGRGAGSDVEKGKNSAVEARDEIAEWLKPDCEILFIFAGMGGGTGTGAAPMVAKIAREKKKDMLIVALVTLPFKSEGRDQAAQDGLINLAKHVDAVEIFPNESCVDLLYKMERKNFSEMEAYRIVSKNMLTPVDVIAYVLSVQGEQNIDLNDLKSVLSRERHGGALQIFSGMGKGSGGAKKRVENALEKAFNNYLLGAPNIGSPCSLLAVVTGDINASEHTFLSKYSETWSADILHRNGHISPSSDSGLADTDCEVRCILGGKNSERLYPQSNQWQLFKPLGSDSIKDDDEAGGEDWGPGRRSSLFDEHAS